MPSVLIPQVWSEPTLTERQLPAPTSSSRGYLSGAAVVSVHDDVAPASTAAHTAAITARLTKRILDTMVLKRLGRSDDGGGKRLRAALIFGVVMATLEMALVLWLGYC